ncbi:putative RNA-directed DNA polymerase from transposon X-element [Trichonephila clavipes]|nr:putative RNA-directed DNA polymerase from transposon X-element [Trichonephila clavipes]
MKTGQPDYKHSTHKTTVYGRCKILQKQAFRHSISTHCTTGTAITDKQKADILAESILTNFTENERQNNDFEDDDEIVNNTVNAFLSHPPPPTAETAYPSEIISYIKSSNPKKAPGKDGISNRMTKNFTLKAILILTILINKILKHNYFLKSGKRGYFFPILKPGKSKNNPASYRPISLLSTLSKITESIILTRLKNIININKTINPNQYGFTNKLSTLHPLLNLTEAISEGFQRKKSTGAVFLDIQKSLRSRVAYRINFQAHHVQHSPHPLFAYCTRTTPIAPIRFESRIRFQTRKYSLRSSTR